MRTNRFVNRRHRRGTVLPMLGFCLVALFGFVALAVDLGMMAVARTECQNAADVSALVGCRTLNNRVGTVNSNLTQAVATAKSTTTGNTLMNGNFTAAQIQKVEAGQYLYDPTSQTFSVTTWTDVTNSQSAVPTSGSWTAIRVTLNVAQPTFFMKVFGINTMPTGAVATAVYKPRDVAFVLDMTGSMGYATTFNYSGSSLNPDNLVPMAGHYVGTQSNLIASANLTNGSGEAISRNNYTITTPGGPPVVRSFYSDSSNFGSPATSAYPVNTGSLVSAFHNISAGAETAGNPTTYTPSSYDFSSYNAFDSTRANGPTPAPPSFGSMTDSGGITYIGDRWRRADGSINKTDTTWATGAVTTRGAANAIELLGYNVSGTNVRGGTAGTTTITTVDAFRDKVWEANGYDLNVVQYRTDKGTGNPKDPAGYAAPLVPAADRFIGYSMGPGYWGKTFYCWPPDPRFDATANLTSPNSSKPGFDTSGKAMCDWRRHFFLNKSGAAFDPQGDNNPTTVGTAEGINQVLLTSTTGNTISSTTSNYQVNYPAVLKWIKSGVQTLPPNLRAGRVLYYSSIPDDVTVSGSTQVDLDKVFWKRYIDYTLGLTSTASTALYGNGDSWASGTTSIYASPLSLWTGPTGFLWAGQKPYMRYNDNPVRPRLQMWFGPLTMLDFIGNIGTNNWNPGTCTEAQCWQLKAGVSSVLDDIQANHPNHYVGMTMFAASAYNDMRVSMGQDFTALKNALFYPKSLLTAINGGDTTSEIRPYNTSWTSVAGDEIPNANGSTDPNTGLAYAFNLLSPSASLPSQYTTTVNGQPVRGRRGAGKLVIFETDGVPNGYRSFSFSKKGYDSYYPTSGSFTSTGNGVEPCMSQAVSIVTQMRVNMASTNTNGLDSGLSLPNAKALIYPIGFGDLFDPVAAPSATFRPTALQFLANVATAGGTPTNGSTTIPDNQIITGDYTQRITRLKGCLQTIFQSGVAVTLIE